MNATAHSTQDQAHEPFAPQPMDVRAELLRQGVTGSAYYAVSELIEADKGYDAALQALKDLNRKIAEQGWMQVGHDELRQACAALVNAEFRRNAALERACNREAEADQAQVRG